MSDHTSTPAFAEFDEQFDKAVADLTRQDQLDRSSIVLAVSGAPLAERAALIRRGLIRILGSEEDLLAVTAAWFHENPSDTRRQRVMDTLAEAAMVLDSLEYRFGPVAPAGVQG